jgi:hypothetical protein
MLDMISALLLMQVVSFSPALHQWQLLLRGRLWYAATPCKVTICQALNC